MASESVGRPAAASRPWVSGAALVLACALVLAGCGGSSASAAPATAAPEATTAATAPAGAASTDPGSGGDADTCGAATAVLVQKGLTSPAVVRVSSEAGCGDAWIETTLAASMGKEAVAICEAAALIAYAGDMSSVTVTGVDDVELAISIKGQDCLARS